jgi:AraC-like DNA-binding protein
LKIHIKYMLSARCKMAVKDALKSLGLHFIFVELGEVEIMETPSTEQMEKLKIALEDSGFELMEDNRAILIERIKAVIIDLVYHSDEIDKFVFSNVLSERLGHPYSYIANLFTEIQGITIQQFIIAQKVARIKELLIYGELSLTEISYKMNYSSVAHLSFQFKKATGLTTSHFMDLKNKRQSLIEEAEIKIIEIDGP